MRLKGVAKRSADKAQIAVYNQSLFARKPLVLKALYHQKMIAVRNRGFYKQLCVLIGYIATEINRYKHFGADKFRDQLEIINDFSASPLCSLRTSTPAALMNEPMLTFVKSISHI